MSDSRLIFFCKSFRRSLLSSTWKLFIPAKESCAPVAAPVSFSTLLVSAAAWSRLICCETVIACRVSSGLRQAMRMVAMAQIRSGWTQLKKRSKESSPMM